MMNNINFLLNNIINGKVKNLAINRICENANLLNNRNIKEENLKEEFYSLRNNIEKFVFIDIFEIFKNFNKSYKIFKDIK